VHYRRSLILPLVLALAACATPAPPPPAEPPPPALLPVIDFPPPPQKIVMVDPFQGAAADLEPLPPATGDLWDRIVLGYKIPDLEGPLVEKWCEGSYVRTKDTKSSSSFRPRISRTAPS